MLKSCHVIYQRNYYDIETLRSNLNMISKFKKLKMEIWICIYYFYRDKHYFRNKEKIKVEK